MGLCHGWAVASFRLKRPEKKITVVASDGVTNIIFYPSDIKALASLLWAKARTPSRFIGARCEDKSPAKDENGRILNQDCFNINPATFHLALTNHIGVQGKSFVMDATYDYEVWNQPILSYQYGYFNPSTKKMVKTIQEAIVRIEAFNNDIFKTYRSQQAKIVVGVAMEVTYLIESAPSHQEYDSKGMDLVQSVTYLYDIEVDEKGEAIGGEWYTNFHPDFLWTPPHDVKARSVADTLVENMNWTGKQPLRGAWLQAGKISSSHSQPLARLVDSLIYLSRH
jgi:hypothetical protein